MNENVIPKLRCFVEYVCKHTPARPCSYFSSSVDFKDECAWQVSSEDKRCLCRKAKHDALSEELAREA